MIEIIRMEQIKPEDDEQTVEISLIDYEALVWRDSILAMMLNGLFENANLSYREDELSFSATNIDQIIRYGFPERYSQRLRYLKGEKARQDAEAERDEMIQLVNLKDDAEDEAEKE